MPYPTPSQVNPERVRPTGPAAGTRTRVATDKQLASTGAVSVPRTTSKREALDVARSKANDLVAKRDGYTAKINILTDEIAGLKTLATSELTNKKIAEKERQRKIFYTLRGVVIADLLVAQARVKTLQTDAIKAGDAGGRAGGAGGLNTPSPLSEDKSAKMNLSACKELYFRGTESFMFGLNGTKDISANAPGSPAEWRTYLADASYKNAETLWKSGVATKGRIQTFIPPSSSKIDSKASTAKSSSTGGTTLARGRKMFQFHYNPGSVGVSYGSVSDIDLGNVIAQGGPLTNVYSALGQVQFELLINRMPDMKHIKSEGNFKKEGVDYLQLYDRTPITDAGRTNELKEIYNKGTMYDIEFLLKILMGGVSYKSWLRGSELTSDIGFVVPQPVELHLGTSLRYVISMTGLSLKHVIFNERMVPLFTTLSITANRLPADAIGTSSTDLRDSSFTGASN